MSNKEEENYLDNLLKNVMEPHPVQPRERGTDDVEEMLTEEPAEDSTNNLTIDMKTEEAQDFNMDDLMLYEPETEEQEETMEEEISEPELNAEEQVPYEPETEEQEETMEEETSEPELNAEEQVPYELETEEQEETMEEEISEPERNAEEQVPDEPILEELAMGEPIVEQALDSTNFSLDELENTISEPTQVTEQNLDMEDDVLDLDALEKELEEFSTVPEAAEEMESEKMSDSLLEDMEKESVQDLTLDDDILKEMGLDEPIVSLENTGEEDDFSDVLSLLGDDDSDLAEINDLLNKSDDTEPVEDDMMNLLNQMADDEEKQFTQEKQIEEKSKTEHPEAVLEEAAADVQEGKAKKVKKKKVNADDEAKGKKSGFFGKLFHALTDEFEPEPTEEELAKEAEEKAAAKLEAKTKKDEEKKAKEEEKKAKAEEKEAAKKAKAEADAVKKREKQEAKEAKLAEKRAKEEAERPKNQKRISPKKMVLVTIFAASVLAGVLLFTNLVSEEGSLQRARKAYYAGNYQMVYVEMYGSQLEESDAIVQAKSKIILKMQRKYDSYVNHLKMGQELQAVNALIEGLRTYDSINLEAEQYGVMAEVDEIKNNIVNVLNANYGISEVQARELLQNEDVIAYTKSLKYIIK